MGKATKKAKDPQLVARLYTTGMQLADCLRLLGEHEAAHDTEVWVIALVQGMGAGTANTVRGSK